MTVFTSDPSLVVVTITHLVSLCVVAVFAGVGIAGLAAILR